MTRKKKSSSRQSYSRRDSSRDGSSSRDEYYREDSSSRDQQDRHSREESSDRYRRGGSSDRYYREESRDRRDRGGYYRHSSSRDDRYSREGSRDRSYRSDDGGRRSSGGGGGRRSYYRQGSSSYYSDEEYDRHERNRDRNNERRARKAGRRPKKLGPSRGGLQSQPQSQSERTLTVQAQKRRNNNHNTKGNSRGINNAKLKAMMEREGLSVVDMASDGNCLFRSVSDQLYGDHGNHHSEVRSEICDFMEDNEDEFKMFLVFDGDGETKQDARDFESYIEDTRRDGVWGGNLELVAAAKLYQRNITVYSATLSVFTIECDAEASGPDLLLSFHSGDHYNSVRPNAGNSKYSRMSSSSRSRKLTKHSSGSSSRRSLSDTVTTSTSTLSVATPTAQECGSESYSAVQPQDSNIVVATVVGIDSAPVVKKNAQCPCGSGKRYKRCCWAKLKEEKKEERRRQNRRERDREISDSEDRRRSKSRDEDEAVGGFKVLAI